MNSWDKYFMDMAVLVASKSKDRSIGVGCVIVNKANSVLSTGYNGFPRGCYDCADDVKYPQEFNVDEKRLAVEARHDRPAKYKWTEHSERNAIYNAARHGIALNDSRIYLPWYPCMDCARAIIQAGVTEVICIKPDFNDERWGGDFRLVDEMFREVGMKVRYVDYPLLETVAQQKAKKA